MSSSASRLGRIVSVAVAGARDPRRAYRTLLREFSSRPTEAADDPHSRFAAGQHVLTGLDVALVFERNGLTWAVPPGDDPIGRELFDVGSYQGVGVGAMVRYAQHERPNASWMIDVGANIGTTSVPMARAGYRCLAIEPVPSTLTFLRRNVAANGLADRITIIDAAVSSSEDEVIVAVSTSHGNSEVVATAGDTPGFARHEVPQP